MAGRAAPPAGAELMVPVVPGPDPVPRAAWADAVAPAPRHAGPTGEELLSGGFIAEVVRVGDTVRRTPPANADFVAALLRHLERVGAGLAPRYLGTDERGRQVLSHLDWQEWLLHHRTAVADGRHA
ncbi:hypothetical protein DLJ46_21535 [Micromonospora globispora]|uniref:Aminoglycoside phosphotransferase n=2 Tax=Micromonospora globispora TaxID=1450148 RepID=A0A317JZG2_9ACTN|nr:hypothetical protein DLJ46_21535 [Micromonospora globispora]RQX06273.1 hypothetical protein DKL51_01605 [Micromonospora globispora]